MRLGSGAVVASVAFALAGIPAGLTYATGIEAFDRFVKLSAPLCLASPASECVDAGWRFVDRDADGLLAASELDTVRADLAAWTDWRRDDLSPQDRTAISIGLLVADMIGTETVVAAYDTDGDARISRGELLADVRLDERPLGQVLLDPDAVDRQAVRARFNGVTPMLDGLLDMFPETE